MKKVILFDLNKRNREFLSIEWEAKFNINILEVDSVVEIIRNLNAEDKEQRILVIKGELDNSIAHDQFSEYLQSNPDIIILYDSQLFLENFSTTSQMIKIDNFFDSQEISKQFLIIGIEESGKKDCEYCKIKFFTFLQFNCTVTDIFIKLGKDNYIKIIHAGELFTREILQKYQKKEIKYLYIHKNDFETFMDEVKKTLLVFYKKQNLNQDILKEVQIASLESINHTLHSVGLTESTIELANKTVISVIESFKEMSRLWSYLKQNSQKGTFLTEHSLSISILACAISNELEWKTDYTLKKIVMAALLHDIAIENSCLAYIRDTADSVFQKLPKNEKNSYLNHPQEACKILKDFPELPSNVDSIILEHHERPNGEGFPRKLSSFHITPLSCVLILAEEFYHLVYQNGFNAESRNSALKTLGKNFSHGNFKSPLNSMVNLFIKGGE